MTQGVHHFHWHIQHVGIDMYTQLLAGQRSIAEAGACELCEYRDNSIAVSIPRLLPRLTRQ